MVFTKETFIIINYTRDKYFKLILQMFAFSCNCDYDDHSITRRTWLILTTICLTGKSYGSYLYH